MNIGIVTYPFGDHGGRCHHFRYGKTLVFSSEIVGCYFDVEKEIFSNYIVDLLGYNLSIGVVFTYILF